jgi:D-alanyl-D-alanine carboxypeptidase/D-alanyl-D-alanine-endopeptidase (penicillin-binding protein 4)
VRHRLTILLMLATLAAGMAQPAASMAPPVAAAPAGPVTAPASPATELPDATPAFVIPPPPPAAPAPQPSTAPSRELITRLARLQEFAQVTPGGRVGLAVGDAAGNELAASGADRPLLPASTMKLVTAAAALRVWGPHHRFVTRVYVTAPPDDAGTVDGDLVLVGGGDPVLHTPRFIRRVNRDRPATSLGLLATRVARAGVTRVTGRVVGDPSILAHEPLAEGWRDEYLTSLDTSRSSGLTVDAGVRLFTRSGTLRAEAASDPAERAAIEFKKLLDDRGVRNDRAAVSRGGEPADGVEIARVSSPPLSELLAHMLRVSDNHLADGVFRMLGAATGDPTWRGSAAAVQGALTDIDADWETVRVADGSGLSRADRLSADMLVRLLRAMGSSPLREQWLDLQATAGESGTMTRRLQGTQAEGRVHAKTGTLRDVRSLAGTVPGTGGDDHHFAVLANDLGRYPDITAARRLADVMALALVVEQDGCRGPIVVADRRPARSPEALICAVQRPR